MRRYYIATRILLILSAIDFKLALAAPVLMQEKLQTRVDVPSISKSVTTGLGKRLGGELEKLGEVYFKTSGKSIDSSGIHPSPSSAPSGPDHGSTVVQPPAPDPASSSANLDPSTESPCSASCSSSAGLSARGHCFSCLRLLDTYAHGLANELQEHPVIDLRPLRPMLSESESSSETEYEYDSESESDSELPWLPPHAPQPHPSLSPPTNQNMGLDRNRLANAGDPQDPPQLDSLRLNPAPPKEDLGDSQALGYAPDTLPGAGSSTVPEYEPISVPPTGPIRLKHLASSTANDETVDPPSAIDGLKGKAKSSRGISGSTRDVENAAQSLIELQLAERSLGPGE